MGIPSLVVYNLSSTTGCEPTSGAPGIQSGSTAVRWAPGLGEKGVLGVQDDEAEESKPAERRPALADRVPTSNLRSNQDNFKIQEEQRWGPKKRAGKEGAVHRFHVGSVDWLGAC